MASANVSTYTFPANVWLPKVVNIVARSRHVTFQKVVISLCAGGDEIRSLNFNSHSQVQFRCTAWVWRGEARVIKLHFAIIRVRSLERAISSSNRIIRSRTITSKFFHKRWVDVPSVKLRMNDVYFYVYRKLTGCCTYFFRFLALLICGLCV